MKYPFQPEFIFVVVVFILILFVSSYGSTNIVPYVHSNSKLPLYPYEGFIGNADITPESLNVKVAKNPIYDAPRSELLQGYPLNKPERSYDVISNLDTSHDCIGKGSNLSNTTGSVCFDRKTLELIHNRGGNQTVPYTDKQYKIDSSK